MYPGNLVLPVICLASISIGFAGCLKTRDNSPKNPTAITTVHGHVRGKYTGRPFPGITIVLNGERPHEPCLFCPTYYLDELATAETDSNGNFYMSATASTAYTSMYITAFGAASYELPVVPGLADQNIDFQGSEYIVTAETFRVRNNANPPLLVYAFSYFQTAGGRVFASDSTFTTYAYIPPGESYQISYSYTDNTGRQHYQTVNETAGSYVDTVFKVYNVDASSF